jgi:hypothetical protein
MMRRSLVFLSSFLILAVLAPAVVSAQTISGRSEQWDFSFQTRYTMAEDYSGEGGSTLHVKEDLGWGFGFNYNLNLHFSLGAIFSWRTVPYEATGVSAEDPSDVIRYGGQINTSNAGLSGEYNILKGRFTPYVNASLNWMLINTVVYGDKGAAYTLGLGGRFEVSHDTFLRAGYERGWTSSGPFDGSNMIRLDIGFMF